MERTTLLWTLVLFFGASLVFASLHRATEGESAALTLGVQVVALVALVAAVVTFVRRRR